MSELRSAIEELRSEALADLPDGRIEDDFTELQRAAELLEVERLRRLAEIERRATYQRDGHLSAASWLASRFRSPGVPHGSTSVSREVSRRCPRRGEHWAMANFPCQRYVYW
jgi:hypothetical protein